MAKMKNKERKSIKAAAKSQVAEIFAVEDTAQQKSLLEDAFEEAKTQITDLESALETASDEKNKLVDDIEALKAKNEELDKYKTEVEKEKSELEKSLAEATKQIEELTKKIDDMEKDAAMNLRSSELENLGLISKGKTAERQKAKIRNMSDEEYADYKSELLELRETWEQKTKDNGDKGQATKSDDVKPDNAGTDDDIVDDDKPENTDDTVDDLDTKTLTEAKINELKRVAASLNKASSGDNVDENGVDLELKSKFDKMWEEEE